MNTERNMSGRRKMGKKRLALVGCGKLGTIVADAWKNGLLPEYELVGVLGRTEESAGKLAERIGCRACRSLEDLLQLQPDYVAEMASVQAVKEMAEPVLCHGANLVVLSIGAFADPEFYEMVRRTAAEHGTRVHIASGAVGGFDVLHTVSLMGEVKASMTTHKGPLSLQNTPLFQEKLLEEGEKTEVFAGNTKEAIALLPTKVNVSVAASLATVGPEQLDFHIFSVPGMAGDDHRIEAETEGIRAVVDIYSSTAAIAGWSVVALLQNLVSPIMF